MRRPFQVAIDGFAASGKSTTAKILAHRLGFMYIDSGAMYRVITLNALKENALKNNQIKNLALIQQTAQTLNIRYESRRIGGSNDEPKIQLSVFQNDKDVSDAIRTPQISQNVAVIASDPIVREKVLFWQRKLANDTELPGVVMDGRDIGTSVWPNADLKIFLNADPMERARRRWEELKEKHPELKIENVLEDIKKRDEADLNRRISPLKKASDAVEINATFMTPMERALFIEKLVFEKGYKNKQSRD